MMEDNKYQRALGHMEDCKYENRCESCKLKLNCTFEEDHRLLQELIDRETPVKIKKARLNDSVKFPIYRYLCAKCGNELSGIDKYCPLCGQKLDWGEENDEEKSRE